MGLRITPTWGIYGDMKLSRFMSANKISDAELAASIGVSVGAVRKWRYGERTPRPAMLARIFEATNGAVSANDFMLPDREAA